LSGSTPADRANAAQRYDAWYQTPRGAWIGEREYALLRDVLDARRGETVLDVGCGTGHFTRLFAERAGVRVAGLDPDLDWLRYAQAHARANEAYVAGRSERLPFPDRTFDCTIAVTSLCFVRNQEAALREIVRVTRRRLALGLLNRRSLLYLQKGRGGGVGAYRGAYWHTPAEARALLARVPVQGVRLRSAIFLPAGGALARAIESWLPAHALVGAFLLVAADIAG
jgi:SAM-dependent methyltransferase